MRQTVLHRGIAQVEETRATEVDDKGKIPSPLVDVAPIPVIRRVGQDKDVESDSIYGHVLA